MIFSSFGLSMRKPLLFALLSLFVLTASAQVSSDYGYSVGVRAYTLKQMPRIMDELDSRYFTSAPLNGIMLKFNDNQISYRLNGTYYKKSKQFFNNCETCEEANGKLVDYSFNIGFEKNFNYSRIQPYFGADLGYRSNTFTGDLQNRNQLRAERLAQVETGPVQVDASKTGLVLSPFFGIKVSPVAQVSLFVEGNLDFFYSYERQETTLQDAGNTKSLKKYYKSEFLLNPVSAGIQFHFGNNK